MRNDYDHMLAVDPGLSTGWATYDTGDHESGQIKGPMEFADWFNAYILDVVKDGTPDFTVVSEAFIITVQTAKLSAAPWSLELIGVMRWICHTHNIPFTIQKPSQAKKFSTDSKIKTVLWYKPGKGHANDASRHLLLRQINMRNETLLEVVMDAC